MLSLRRSAAGRGAAAPGEAPSRRPGQRPPRSPATAERKSGREGRLRGARQGQNTERKKKRKKILVEDPKQAARDVRLWLEEYSEKSTWRRRRSRAGLSRVYTRAVRAAAPTSVPAGNTARPALPSGTARPPFSAPAGPPFKSQQQRRRGGATRGNRGAGRGANGAF